MLYVAKPRAWWEGDDEPEEDFEPSLTARTVHEVEDDSVFTGLLDHHGQRLYRVPERCKMGFVK